MAASGAAGVEPDRVRVNVPLAGGSFGLHSSSTNDPTTEAVQIAKALEWKYPIKVQSPREEEFKSGRFRAMAAHRVRAGADDSETLPPPRKYLLDQWAQERRTRRRAPRGRSSQTKAVGQPRRRADDARRCVALCRG